MIEKFSSPALEQLVLHSMIEDISLFHAVREVLKETHFFDESHKSIYRGIRELDDRYETITVETLSNWLILNDNNAVPSLSILLTVSPIPKIETIVSQLVELANQRKLWLLSKQIQNTLEQREGSYKAIELMEQGITSVDVISGTKAKSYRDLVAYYESQPPLPVMKTGTFLDNMLGRGGVTLGGLVLLMGSPEAGKTVYGVQILEYVSRVAPTLFFCFEFTVREYVKLSGDKKREIYLDSKKPLRDADPKSDEEREQTQKILNRSSANMQIIDEGYDVSDIERECKIWHKKGARLALIDSQMRVENANGKFNTIEAMESDKFSRLAKLCHRYEMTILFICQQGKEDTKTGQHTPMNSKKGAHEASAIVYIDRPKPKYDSNGVDENRFTRFIEVSKNKFTGKHTRREHRLNPATLTLHKVNSKREEAYKDNADGPPEVIHDDQYKIPQFDMPKI